MDNKLVTKTVSVWVSIHPDHYSKHLFKTMCLIYRYDDKEDLLGISIHALTNKPCKVNIWSYNTTHPSKDEGEEEVNKTIVNMASKLSKLIDTLKDQYDRDLLKDVILEANLIASQNNEDENMESKLDRLTLSKLDDFDVKEVEAVDKKVIK